MHGTKFNISRIVVLPERPVPQINKPDMFLMHIQKLITRFERQVSAVRLTSTMETSSSDDVC
jgi:hypothetical protein